MKLPHSQSTSQPPEGVLWVSRQAFKGLPRINATPFTNARCKRFAARAKSPTDPFAPTVQPVAQVMPPHHIPKFKDGNRVFG
jgi:hypothetical protein